jgi:hypothetical protein
VLSESLTGWVDSDGAAYQLGRSLGLFLEQTLPQVKHVFWTDSELGAGLHAALLALVDAGVLEYREAEDQFRWRP